MINFESIAYDRLFMPTHFTFQQLFPTLKSTFILLEAQVLSISERK